MKDNIKKIGKDENWLIKELDAFNLKPEDALIVTVNEKWDFFYQKKHNLK